MEFSGKYKLAVLSQQNVIEFHYFINIEGPPLPRSKIGNLKVIFKNRNPKFSCEYFGKPRRMVNLWITRSWLTVILGYYIKGTQSNDEKFRWYIRISFEFDRSHIQNRQTKESNNNFLFQSKAVSKFHHFLESPERSW